MSDAKTLSTAQLAELVDIGADRFAQSDGS
jgi:hypothetical protein